MSDEQIEGPTLDLLAPGAAHGAETLPLATILNGRFRLDQLLGEGGMGIVYRATDLVSGRELALKVLRKSRRNATTLALFKNEFAMLAELDHPNIVSVYDFEHGQASSECFFTMELLLGKDALAATNGALLEVVLDVGVQALRALACLHTRGVVHLDLKPRNVMISTTGHVWLFDFGVARSVGSAAPRLFATPRYTAPEVLDDGAEVDGRADLYSFGVTLFQLLFAHLPRFGPDRELVLDVAQRSRVPPWLLSVLERLLERDASRRFATANQVLVALAGGRGDLAEIIGWYVSAAEGCFRRGALQAGLDFVEHARECGANHDALNRLLSFAAETARLCGDPRAATFAGLALSSLPPGSDAWLQASRVAIAEFNPSTKRR